MIKIHFDGSTAYVESYIFDNDKLIFVEVSGEDSMVRANLAVLMQGRTSLNNNTITISNIGYFAINKEGNKRLIVASKDKGSDISHAILYHHPSFTGLNYSVVVGESEEDVVKNSFPAWLRAHPIPYPTDTTRSIYEELKLGGFIEALDCYNIFAIKINDKVFQNEYEILRECILNNLPKDTRSKRNEPLNEKKYLKCPHCHSEEVEVSEVVDDKYWCSCIDCDNIFTKPYPMPKETK